MCVCVLHGCVCVFPCARDREPVCEFYIYIKKESATRMYTKTKKKEIKKPVSQRLCVCACAYVCV